MKCSYCGSDDHPWFNCRKKSEGWKPPKQSTGSVMLDRPCVVQFHGHIGPEGGSIPSPVDTPPKPRGRPRTGFDKKAYDKERMKKARAALKAKRNG